MATDKITLEELQKMISYLEATVDNSGEKLMPTPAVKNEKTNCEKVESFRKQGEYGPKKFIKPWRTGTKSQQQYAPKGHKKGFRGKTVATRK